jgi:hypothetical protein
LQQFRRSGVSVSLPSAPEELDWLNLVLVSAGVLSAVRRGTLRAPEWRHAALWTSFGIFGWGFPFFHALLLWHFGILVGPLRSLGRLATDMLVGVPLLLGLAAGELFWRVRNLGSIGVVGQPLLLATVTGLMLAQAIPTGPYPTIAEPALPAQVRAAIIRTGGPVLELPNNGPVQDTLAMYHSIGDWWPVVNGYASFWPPGFAERMQAIDRLPNQAALEWLVAQTGLRTLVVNALWLHGHAPAWTTRDVTARTGLRPIARASRWVVFAVGHPPRQQPDRPPEQR